MPGNGNATQPRQGCGRFAAGSDLTAFAARIAAAAQFAAAAMLALIALINITNVAGRYVFARPIEPAEEWMLFLMVGAVFLSFVKVTHDRAHIRMDALQRALPEPLRRPLELLGDAVSIAVALTIVYVGTPIVVQLARFGQQSDTGIPMAIPQSMVPIGFALAGLICHNPANLPLTRSDRLLRGCVAQRN